MGNYREKRSDHEATAEYCFDILFSSLSNDIIDKAVPHVGNVESADSCCRKEEQTGWQV